MKKAIYGAFFFLGVCFISFFIYLDNKADRDFCCKAFSGTIIKEKKNEKGYKSILLHTGEWHHLGQFYSYSKYHIRIGDSIVKHKGTYLIEVFKNGEKMVEYSYYRNKECNCK